MFSFLGNQNVNNKSVKRRGAKFYLSKAIVRFKLYFFFTNLFLSQKPFLGKFKIYRCWIKKSPQIGQCYGSTDFGNTCACHDKAKDTPSSQDITPAHSFFSY